MTGNKIDNSLGNLFMPPQIGFGYLIIAIGIAVLFSGGVAGIGTGTLLILAGGIISFSVQGIQIDPGKKTYRKYIKFFYLVKIGARKKLTGYVYVTVIGSNKGYAAISLTTRRLAVSNYKYDIRLQNKDNSKRLIVKSMKNKDDAVKFAINLANNSYLEYFALI